MKHSFKKTLLALYLTAAIGSAVAQSKPAFNKYHTPAEVQSQLTNFQLSNPQLVTLHPIAVSPGGVTLNVIEIGRQQTDGPAVFVGANLDGTHPLATEGAMWLAQFLIDSAAYRSNVKWFILPVGNPDAAANFFSTPRYRSTLNRMHVNLDVDDQTNEDGYEDLNGDGFITMMRKASPEGLYRISDEDARLLVKADPVKGDRGIYKLYTEGIDNDGDGLFNEDEPGGVNPGINFPHDFQHFNKEAGLWPGYAPETFGIMKFIYEHPEIAMSITLGGSNFLLDVPQEGRSDFDPNRIRVPERLARQLGITSNQPQTMQGLLDLMASRFPDWAVNENTVLSQLNLGPEKNFRKNDLIFYQTLAKSYKEHLAANKLPTSRMAPEKPRSGSFELWSYFHLGVPSIALSLWEPDAAADTSTSRGSGNAQGANARQATASPSAVSQEKQWLNYFDTSGKQGFANWQPFSHPQLGDVEIGGFIPFASNTPPADAIDDLLKGQLPFIAALPKMLPNILLAEEKVTALGGGIYKVELFIDNKGSLPYPTSMGQRNEHPVPLVLILEGNEMEILEGQKRTPINHIGSNQIHKQTYLVKTGKAANIKVSLTGPAIKNQTKQIPL